MHVMLQPGRALYGRFTRPEAAALWEAYARVDAALQQPERLGGGDVPLWPDLNWEAGFQGGPTPYLLHAVPEGEQTPIFQHVHTGTLQLWNSSDNLLYVVRPVSEGDTWYLPDFAVTSADCGSAVSRL
jgi:hypothetical protein